MSRILLFNKPYGVICQFSRDGLHSTLADYIPVPGFYPAGRLDTQGKRIIIFRQTKRYGGSCHPKQPSSVFS